MSDGHLRSPGNNPQSNLPPLTGFETPGVGSQPAVQPGAQPRVQTTTQSTVQYSQTAAAAYEAPQGHGPGIDPEPRRRGLSLPRIIGFLALLALLALAAWFLLNRGDDGDTTNTDTTAQITEGDAASDDRGGEAMADDDDADGDGAMADDSDDQAMADDDDAMADGDDAMADDGDGAMADDSGADAVAEEPGSVIDTMLANTDLSIVADGIGQLGLDNDLAGEGPFTILAPTNDAFFLVSEAEAGRLLGDEVNATSVLSYHVLQGDFSAENFVTALEAQGGSLTVDALNGEEITVELIGDQVVLNGNSVVVDPDQPATNGVVHTISELLVPPSLASR